MFDGHGGKFGQVMSIMREENGIAKVMQEPTYDLDSGDTASQAELIADLLNLERLDVKRMADEVGADVTITRMEPDTMAILIQRLVKGESLELVERFNELEDKREKVLEEMLDEDEMEEHRAMKVSQLHSRSSDTEDDTDADEGEAVGEVEADAGE